MLLQPQYKNQSVLVLKISQLVMEHTHSMHVRALNIQLRVQASIHVVVERPELVLILMLILMKYL